MNQACGTPLGVSAVPDFPPTSATLGSTCWADLPKPYSTPARMFLRISAAIPLDSARRIARGPWVITTLPSGRVTLSTRYGCIIQPSLAIADATMAICSGVTCSCPWPKPVSARPALRLR